MVRRVGYILNPSAAAGRAAAQWEAAKAELWRRGLAGPVYVTRGCGDGLERAREQAANVEVLVAVGGDGTVSEVASGLLQRQAVCQLAILPVGTGNDIASQLGLRTVAQAIAVLAGTRLRRIDVIEVQHTEGGRPVVRHALCFASIGFAGELLRWTTPVVKRWFGPRWCYSVGFLRALAAYHPSPVRVQTDAGAFCGRWLHLCAGNFEWAGGGAMRLSPGARCDDGLLDLCLIEAMSGLATAWHFPKLLRGTFVGHPCARYFRSTQVSLDADGHLPLQLDGDLIGSTPARFVVRPGCLPILTPSPA